MNNLAINVSNAPAKSSASKSSGKDEIAQQDGQGFGNVLTRQVAGSGKSAESAASSSADTNSKPANQSAGKTDDKVDTETAPAVDSATANILPVDMLAALLAQQNLQTDAKTKPDQNIQATDLASETEAALTEESGKDNLKAITLGAEGVNIAQATTGIAQATTGIAQATTGIAQATTGKKASTTDSKISSTTVPTNGNIKPADSDMPAITSKGGKAESTAKNNNEFADAFKASLGTKEVATTSDKLALHTKNIGELANTVQQPVVSVPVPSAAAATTASPININTPVTQPAWGDEFSQKVTWMVTERNQSAELHLNPPQLGPLDVIIKVNGDQATAMFTSSHAAVRDAIEQAMPKLREMLADNGIMLGNATVNDQAARNDQEGAAAKSQSGSRISDNNPETVDIQQVRVSKISSHNGMVDTFA